MHQKEKEVKAKVRLDINRTLLAIAFTVFGIIVSINPGLFRESILVPLQMTLAIPLFLSSIFARSKLAYSRMPKMWDDYGYVTFLMGYAFLMNVLGILLSMVISLKLSLIFFIFNFVASFSYSVLSVAESKEGIFPRVKKDLLFYAILVFGGILPVLGFYG